MSTFLQTKKYNEVDNDYFWIKNLDFKTIRILYNLMISNISNFEYSYDKVNWYSASSNAINLNIEPGNKMWFRAKNLISTGSSFLSIQSTGYYELGGSIPALIDYENKETVTTIPDNYFVSFLSNDMDIQYLGKKMSSYCLKADRLDFGNITTVGTRGMYDMFKYSSITKSPDLSRITTIGNYGMYRLFLQCNNLKEVTDFTSLTNAGDNAMFNMFYYDAGIKTSPDLSSLTTAGNYCLNSMFYNSSVETGADLSSLTTAGNYCCSYMYSGCSKLKQVTYPNITYSQYVTQSWLSGAGTGISGTKTAYVPAGQTIPESNDGIPSGWTRVEY